MTRSLPARMLTMLAALTLLLAVPRDAFAEPAPTPSEVALARQEFVAGVEAARSAQWDEAVARFERSYALYPHPKTLFNVAGAHRQLGHVLAATEAYRKFLRSKPDGDEAERGEAELALRELEPLLPMVTLEVRGIGPGDRVLLDGVPVNPAVLSAELPVDPGGHVLVVQRRDSELAREEFQVDPGARARVVTAVPESEAEPASVVATPEQAARSIEPSPPEQATPGTRVDSSVRTRRMWIGTGALVAAGIVATVLWVALRSEPDEEEGNLGPGSVTVP